MKALSLFEHFIFKSFCKTDRVKSDIRLNSDSNLVSFTFDDWNKN